MRLLKNSLKTGGVYSRGAFNRSITVSYGCIVKNEWLLLSVTFTAIVLTFEKAFFLEFSFLKPTERAQVPLKNGTKEFQNSAPLERLACFYVTISESFKRFQYFNFETNFLKQENLFQRSGVPFFSWNH